MKESHRSFVEWRAEWLPAAAAHTVSGWGSGFQLSDEIELLSQQI